MLAEMLGKGGRLCEPARQGGLHCPLIIRPTSEDAITGNMIQMLRLIQPRWWLPGILNRALGCTKFQRQYYRRFRISLWENRPQLPREITGTLEGSTQVDAILRWENPATTVYLEFKYKSPLAKRTANDPAADQLLRLIRVGLYESGYYQCPGLFEQLRRRFMCFVVGPKQGNDLVQAYSNPARLQAALSQNRASDSPINTNIGELGYADVIQVLRCNLRWMTRSERQAAEDLYDYLRFKSSLATECSPDYQQRLAVV